ncbi:MAG: hypothetical protein AVDCRST_MAG66-3367 [uncultured Pseudonocardia sp.]|uniref:Uncharacterized protein n=1 Tax=uncultured Pseudonocardia sp. TaxID=211455 RepID=A0A6J4Q188_9PSEU|nr:MAG: hypothetical protein AVDCRST_MAG66-3367 [uncultured Pseudonocardia sp.]
MSPTPGPPSGDRRVRVLLSVDPDRFADTVTEAHAAGLEVTEEMPAIGIVRGDIPADRLSALSDVSGVDSVEEDEEDRRFRLPPPDSPVQ